MRWGCEPDPGRRDPLAGSDGRRMSDHRHKVALAPRLDLEHAEAGLGVVKGDALDRASERLYRCAAIERLSRRTFVHVECSITWLRSHKVGPDEFV